MSHNVAQASDLAANAGLAPGYNFSAPASGQQPYVFYVPQGISGSPPFNITIFIPNIFSTAPAQSITSGPFTLQPTVSGGNQAGLPYKITVPASSAAWTFDNSPIRQGVHDAFIAFLIAIENNDGTHGAQVLKPGRLRFVQQYLSQVLPQTFVESLFFRYGLDPLNRCVDLLPGMRVRLTFQAHQALDPQQNPLNGFVGAGEMLLDVATLLSNTGSLNIALGAFLSQLQSVIVAANAGGAGGGIDLQGAAFAYPYYRLLYPQNYPSSDGVGYTGIQQNPTILAAASYADLVAATAAYVSSGQISGQSTAAFFRGRTVAIPEVPIFVQGEMNYVPVGTTIRQLLSGIIPVPYMDVGNVALPSQFYTRLRTVLNGAQSPPTWSFQPSQTSTAPVVNLATQTGGYACYGAAQDSFDLPVLGGDNLSIPLPQAS
jgi:hypothetical protein